MAGQAAEGADKASGKGSQKDERHHPDELVVHEKPEITEHTETSPEGESQVGTDRTNLPGSTEPGTVYRDIRISHRLAARLKSRSE